MDSALAVYAGVWPVVLMWASTFSLFKVAWREIDPVAFTGVQFAAMVLVALGLLAVSHSRPRFPERPAGTALVRAHRLLRLPDGIHSGT